MKISFHSLVDRGTVKRLFQLAYKHFAQYPEVREYVDACVTIIRYVQMLR